MNTLANLEVENFNWDMITIVKKQVDELYYKHQIYSLSLETLELTRRFNNQYKYFDALPHFEPVELNKFHALARHLERNLVQELKY